jgi:MipA family protein
MKFLVAGALCAGLAIGLVPPAMAQDAPAAEGVTLEGLDTNSGGITGYVALGVAYAPDYEGSNDYEIYPYLEGRLEYGDYYARLEGSDIRFNVVPSAMWHAGPVLGYRPGRDAVDDDQIDHLRSIDEALTAGAFVEFEHVGEDPRYGETLTLSVVQDVSGFESGLVATLRGVVRRPLLFINPGFIVSVDAEVDFADDNYMATYFDVSQGDAGRSGLPRFNADAGFKDVGAGISIDQFLSPSWSVGTRLHYYRLLDDAADSPVVDDAGSADQFFAAIVGGYRF